ncbi:hypothetical protein PZB74_14870 [Porifericola rhodea]|uniref:hypothetical protein n=1 Tax=Porifericola rhodea TaxID=930972 RepID=UPI002666A390|nr:hypothetical protein [Porifericola rhodea]WKN30246.1 hypothetical protein PZB74_14870 [Porifericola rhodea]
MHYTIKPSILVLICLWLFASCDKLCDCDDDPKPCSFSYGMVSFTPTPGEEQLIKPSFEESQEGGTFSAFPSGLDIDEATGEININNSTYDQEYTITYTLDDGETTCTTSIFIGEPDIVACGLKYEKEMVAPGEIDFLLARVDEKAVTDGKFYAIPSGLVINPSNGAIDVSASESGTQYTIYYESKDGMYQCQTKLIISGIDFPDTRISLVPEERALVYPYYNADPDQEVPGGSYMSDDPTLAINESTGEVDIKQTLVNVDLSDNETLDQSIVNYREAGFTRIFTINYTVGQTELQSSLEVQLFWFPNEESIPADLLEVFEGKQSFDNGKIEERPPYMLATGGYDK